MKKKGLRGLGLGLALLTFIFVASGLSRTMLAQQSSASHEGQNGLPPPVATFSILGYDPETGEVGGAVESRVFTLPTGVLTADADAGVVDDAGDRRRQLWTEGASPCSRPGMKPDSIIKAIWDSDPDPNPQGLDQAGTPVRRHQFKRRDRDFHGPQATEWAGGKQGKYCTAQGNILAGPAVVENMVKAFEETQGPSVVAAARGDRSRPGGGRRQARHAGGVDGGRQEGRRRVAEQRRRAALPGRRSGRPVQRIASRRRELEQVTRAGASETRSIKCNHEGTKHTKKARKIIGCVRACFATFGTSWLRLAFVLERNPVVFAQSTLFAEPGDRGRPPPSTSAVISS